MSAQIRKRLPLTAVLALAFVFLLFSVVFLIRRNRDVDGEPDIYAGVTVHLSVSVDDLFERYFREAEGAMRRELAAEGIDLQLDMRFVRQFEGPEYVEERLSRFAAGDIPDIFMVFVNSAPLIEHGFFGGY